MTHNSGRLIHELMVERAPIKTDGPGRPNEDASIGMIEDMKPGTSGRMTLQLKPGTYELFCNVTEHYAAGQHTTFTVTKSGPPPGLPRAAPPAWPSADAPIHFRA